MSQSGEELDHVIAKEPRWKRLDGASRPDQIWTDDFANVLTTMRF